MLQIDPQRRRRRAAGAGAAWSCGRNWPWRSRPPPPRRRRRAADVVALAFTSPTLGRLDLRLELRGERLLAEVTTPAGRPHVVADAAAERLRANLEAVGLEADGEGHVRATRRSICMPDRTSPRPALHRRRRAQSRGRRQGTYRRNDSRRAHMRPGCRSTAIRSSPRRSPSWPSGRRFRSRCGTPSHRSWRGPTGSDREPLPQIGDKGHRVCARYSFVRQSVLRPLGAQFRNEAHDVLRQPPPRQRGGCPRAVA